MAELSIVIVNWNTRDLLLGCLRSIAAHPPRRSYELWVVDNGSCDGSVAAVQRLHPTVHLIANPDNRGFAAANNQALRASSGRYVLLLNSDTEVLPGALEAMCAYLDDQPEVGAVGCRLNNADGSAQRSCWRGCPGLRSATIDGLYLWRLFPGLLAHNEVALADHDTPQPVDHLLGACIMTRRAVIQQIGLLDESYYLFLEETDWCHRMRSAGWAIHYLPQPRIVHFGQQSMRQIPARTLPLFYASLCRFVRKRGGRWLWLRIALLKTIIAASVLLRLGLWSVRLTRQRGISLRMLNGYGRVLRQLPTL
jgi:GT2 family glycosyltransferase